MAQEQTQECTTCYTDQPLDQFSWRNKSEGKRHATCKRCHRQYENHKYRSSPEERERKRRNELAIRKRLRTAAFEYLQQHPCVDCGESDPVVLEFDHRDPTTKRACVATLLTQGLSISTLMTEIEKCDVRCANCHRRKTATQFNWWKNQ